MPKAFTAKTVENLKPATARLEIPDPALSGLYLVVQPSGTKSWATRYRFEGKSKKLTLGRWPRVSVADARRMASETLSMADMGKDPGEAKRAQKAAQAAGTDRDTIAALVEQYNEQHLTRLKRGHDTKSSLDRYVVSRWGKCEIQTITRREIRDLLDGIASVGKRITANRVRTRLSGFFNWCIERDIVEHNPVTGIKRFPEVSRDRVLNDDEIRWFWRACEDLGEPWGALGQTLLLTGQRRNEIAHMLSAEFSGDVWTLPAARAKNGRTHELPLSQAALRHIKRESGVTSEAGLLFTTNGATPVSGFSKGRRHIAGRMAEIAAEERGASVVIPNWTFHDLRRTAATNMARIKIPVATIEATLNHVSGVRAGVAGIYNRHSYFDEKRQALEAWARFVEEIVEGQAPSNVVRIAEVKV